jgi:TolB-like protein/DNA-binding winged helix-turn-helix (wHTH) protein/Tfp pilus assembly protein PilF
MVAGRSYLFGAFHLDGAVLFRHGHRVPLTPKVVETLLVLVQAQGRIVSKDELLNKVWPDAFVDETNLTANISILRKTFGASEHQQPYIETVSKRGYRFVVPVKVVEEGSPCPASKGDVPRVRQARRAWMAGLGLAATLVLMVCLAGLRFYGNRRTAPQRILVVVLPVQNLTGDPAWDYIGDGLTEEIIAQLSRFNPSRLGVIARTSSMAYKGTSKTVQQIGRELGVDYVVEGSLRAVSDRTRITAQLVRVQDQTHVWSANYDHTLHDLFSLQDEVAQAIALHVHVELAAASRARLSAAHPLNPDAYLAYLEGRYYWNQRSPEALERAIVHLQQAIQLDATYALAYAGLADAYASQCLIADVVPAEVFPKAKAAALRALELDGELAEGHTSLAYVKFWYDWDWAGAEAEFQRALEISPGYATAHQWYAEYLRLMGRQEDAIVENRKALELDPLSLIINMESGLPYYSERRFDDAIPYFRKTLEMDPNFGLAHCVLGWAYEGKSQYADAINELEMALRLDDSAPVLSSLAHAYALAGRQTDAKRALRRLQERAKKHYVSSFFLATIFVALNQNERALDSLDTAYAHHDWVLLWVNVGHSLDPLRSQPRFVDLLQRLKLPARSGVPRVGGTSERTFAIAAPKAPVQPRTNQSPALRCALRAISKNPFSLASLPSAARRMRPVVISPDFISICPKARRESNWSCTKDVLVASAATERRRFLDSAISESPPEAA